MKVISGCIALLLAGCVAPTVHVVQSPTIRIGSTIQVTSMNQDPLGGVSKLIIALEQRGFIALEGEVGRTVTNRTTKGSETYRKTNANHYLTFTYTTGNGGHGSCRLTNISTGRPEVIVDLNGLPFNAAEICADEILKAAKK